MSKLSIEINHGTLLRFATPTVLMFLLLNVYFIIDGIFVSRAVGTAALAAVNIIMPILGTTFALAAMLSTGGNALIAHQLGEDKLLDARQNFSLLIAVSFMSSVLIALVCLIFLERLIFILGADEQLFELCRDYSIPILISTPFVLSGMVIDNFFMVEGRPELSLLSSTIGGITNIALDYIFLFELGMGIEGAAIATGIGYTLSAIVGLIYFGMWKCGTLHFVQPKWRPRVLIKSMSNGISELVTALAMSLTTVVLNSTMMMLAGGNGVAAISILMYIEELLLAAYMGYSEGIAPLISFNQGARNFERLKKIFRCSLRIIAASSIATFGLSIIVSKPLIGIFVAKGNSVYVLAEQGFKVFAIGFLFAGFNAFASALFTALNDGKTSALLSFCHTMIFLMGMLIVLPRWLGLDGIWLASPVAEFLSILLGLCIIRRMASVYNY